MFPLAAGHSCATTIASPARRWQPRWPASPIDPPRGCSPSRLFQVVCPLAQVVWPWVCSLINDATALGCYVLPFRKASIDLALTIEVRATPIRKIRHGFIAITVLRARPPLSSRTRSSRRYGPKRHPVLPMSPLSFNRLILNVRKPRNRAEHLIAIASSGPWTNAQPVRTIAIPAPSPRSFSS